uniref:Uncharacterized protein n=1 Tax=Picea glauca TaxID=3330 RepID=A0A117NH66_PICGL|nr:hypothetical protein ABT39_MTgene4898 [Picea glauca]QHR92442.1 hypothetical protein Q903MT_gene6488 [Picea sitchensis]
MTCSYRNCTDTQPSISTPDLDPLPRPIWNLGWECSLPGIDGRNNENALHT